MSPHTSSSTVCQVWLHAGDEKRDSVWLLPSRSSQTHKQISRCNVMRTGKGKRKRERMFWKHAVGAPSSNWCWGWPGQSGWVSRSGVSTACPGWGGPGERERVPGQGSHVQRQGAPDEVMLPEPGVSFALELRYLTVQSSGRRLFPPETLSTGSWW